MVANTHCYYAVLPSSRGGSSNHLDEKRPERVAKTEVFRVYPSRFEGSVAIALYAEHNFKAASYGKNDHQPSTSHRLNLWISAILMIKKYSFKLLISCKLSVVAILVELLDIYALLAL